MHRKQDDPDEYTIIFRPWITKPDGTRIYPKKGRVFPIRVPKNRG